MNDARPQIPTPMSPHRIVCGNGSMLCGAAKYLELDISVTILMSLFDAAVPTASMYGSFDEKQYLNKVTLVSKVPWCSMYRCRHHVNLVNAVSRNTALIRYRSDMSNDPGHCGILKFSSEVNCSIHGAHKLQRKSCRCPLTGEVDNISLTSGLDERSSIRNP